MAEGSACDGSRDVDPRTGETIQGKQKLALVRVEAGSSVDLFCRYSQ